MRKRLDPNSGKIWFAPGPLNLELSTSCKKVCFLPPAQQKGTLHFLLWRCVSFNSAL